LTTKKEGIRIILTFEGPQKALTLIKEPLVQVSTFISLLSFFYIKRLWYYIRKFFTIFNFVYISSNNLSFFLAMCNINGGWCVYLELVYFC